MIRKHGRPTIALMLRDLSFDQMWNGVIQTADRLNLNLTILYGDNLKGISPNMIYGLVTEKSFDGVITWASSDNDEYTSFYDKLRGVPLVSLSLPLKNHPYIAIDNMHGMKEIVNHLIRVHNKKRIAFIKGPDTHVYARERFEAYKATLIENAMEVDKRLIVEGTWEAESGIQSFHTLFKERGLKPGKDIDAIVTIQDKVVLPLMDELFKAGIHVPGEVAVTGYDHTKEGMCASPRLTTVEMPFYEQGEAAVKLLVDLMAGKKVPETNMLKSRSIIQQSCGCGHAVLDFFNSNRVPAPKEKGRQAPAADEARIGVTAAIVDTLKQKMAGKTSLPTGLESAVPSLVSACVDELIGRKQGAFVPLFTDILARFRKNFSSLEPWDYALVILKNELSSTMPDTASLLRLDALIDQARILLGIVERQNGIEQNIAQEASLGILRNIGAGLSGAITPTDIEKVLSAFLPQTGIRCFFLSLYKNPQPYRFGQSIPEISNLILASSKQYDFKVSSGGITYRTDALLPDDIMNRLGRFSFMVLPLLHKETQIGFMIVDRGPLDKFIYPLLREQLSSALHTIQLFAELSAAKDQMENVLTTLRLKASEISEHSRQNSSRVNDISIAMDQTASGIKAISANISKVMQMVSEVVKMGMHTNAIIQELKEQSQKIGKVTEFISDIAEQTNVLSINAAIEAARAGITGKGFSIVAAEVKGLSKKTVSYTQEISQLIDLVRESTDVTVDNVAKMIDHIRDIDTLSANITAAISQQSATANNIADLLTDSNRSTKKITEAITEVAGI